MIHSWFIHITDKLIEKKKKKKEETLRLIIHLKNVFDLALDV